MTPTRPGSDGGGQGTEEKNRNARGTTTMTRKNNYSGTETETAENTTTTTTTRNNYSGTETETVENTATTSHTVGPKPKEGGEHIMTPTNNYSGTETVPVEITTATTTTTRDNYSGTETETVENAATTSHIVGPKPREGGEHIMTPTRPASDGGEQGTEEKNHNARGTTTTTRKNYYSWTEAETVENTTTTTTATRNNYSGTETKKVENTTTTSHILGPKPKEGGEHIMTPTRPAPDGGGQGTKEKNHNARGTTTTTRKHYYSGTEAETVENTTTTTRNNHSGTETESVETTATTSHIVGPKPKEGGEHIMTAAKKTEDTTGVVGAELTGVQDPVNGHENNEEDDLQPQHHKLTFAQPGKNDVAYTAWTRDKDCGMHKKYGHVSTAQPKEKTKATRKKKRTAAGNDKGCCMRKEYGQVSAACSKNKDGGDASANKKKKTAQAEEKADAAYRGDASDKKKKTAQAEEKADATRKKKDKKRTAAKDTSCTKPGHVSTVHPENKERDGGDASANKKANTSCKKQGHVTTACPDKREDGGDASDKKKKTAQAEEKAATTTTRKNDYSGTEAETAENTTTTTTTRNNYSGTETETVENTATTSHIVGPKPKEGGEHIMKPTRPGSDGGGQGTEEKNHNARGTTTTTRKNNYSGTETETAENTTTTTTTRNNYSGTETETVENTATTSYIVGPKPKEGGEHVITPTRPGYDKKKKTAPAEEQAVEYRSRKKPGHVSTVYPENKEGDGGDASTNKKANASCKKPGHASTVHKTAQDEEKRKKKDIKKTATKKTNGEKYGHVRFVTKVMVMALAYFAAHIFNYVQHVNGTNSTPAARTKDTMGAELTGVRTDDSTGAYHSTGVVGAELTGVQDPVNGHENNEEDDLQPQHHKDEAKMTQDEAEQDKEPEKVLEQEEEAELEPEKYGHVRFAPKVMVMAPEKVSEQDKEPEKVLRQDKEPENALGHYKEEERHKEEPENGPARQGEEPENGEKVSEKVLEQDKKALEQYKDKEPEKVLEQDEEPEKVLGQYKEQERHGEEPEKRTEQVEEETRHGEEPENSEKASEQDKLLEQDKEPENGPAIIAGERPTRSKDDDSVSGEKPGGERPMRRHGLVTTRRGNNHDYRGMTLNYPADYAKVTVDFEQDNDAENDALIHAAEYLSWMMRPMKGNNDDKNKHAKWRTDGPHGTHPNMRGRTGAKCSLERRPTRVVQRVARCTAYQDAQRHQEHQAEGSHQEQQAEGALNRRSVLDKLQLDYRLARIDRRPVRIQLGLNRVRLKRDLNAR
jgi:hypothetical protein